MPSEFQSEDSDEDWFIDSYKEEMGLFGVAEESFVKPPPLAELLEHSNSEEEHSHYEDENSCSEEDCWD